MSMERSHLKQKSGCDSSSTSSFSPDATDPSLASRHCCGVNEDDDEDDEVETREVFLFLKSTAL